MLNLNDKIVITGAAGLVGQNLVTLLVEQGFTQLVAIDKHAANLAIQARLHPGVRTVLADLAEPGAWAEEFKGAAVVVQLHAQIAGKTFEPFRRNNIQATEQVLQVMQGLPGSYLVHASSSVVNSVADDDYVRSKIAQEKLVRASGLRHCVLRPTLMARIPVFPIPGHGRYMRQPLYNRDFCRAILVMMREQPDGAIHDLTGPDRIDYIDMMRVIRDAKGLKTPIVQLPVPLFGLLLRAAALVMSKPPFTVSQMHALMAGDDFTGVDIERVFGFKPLGFREAIRETFNHPRYSDIVLESTH